MRIDSVCLNYLYMCLPFRKHWNKITLYMRISQLVWKRF